MMMNKRKILRIILFLVAFLVSILFVKIDDYMFPRFHNVGYLCDKDSCIHYFNSLNGTEVIFSIALNEKTDPKIINQNFIIMKNFKLMERKPGIKVDTQEFQERILYRIERGQKNQFRILIYRDLENLEIVSYSLNHLIEFEKTLLRNMKMNKNVSLHEGLLLLENNL